jgi:cation:H+ antiporter
LFASFNGTSDIAIGNIVGSNIVNILLILGIAAIIYPLRVGHGTVWKEIPMSLMAMVLLLIMANDRFVDGMSFNLLTRSDGVVLISFFVLFLYYTFGIAKSQNGDEENVAPKDYSVWASIGLVLVGAIGLVFGGKWIVDSATTIAQTAGLSDALIGLTIVAIGTSLPELATSVVAAYKKNVDIAVGNVVGSGIFNVLWILGLSSIIKPLPFKPELNFDLWVAVVASFLLFGWMFLGKRQVLERWQGVLFVVLYVIYIVAIINRG